MSNLFGYAPGDYMCTCSNCSNQHLADKRASTCFECMVHMVTKLQARVAELESELAGSETIKKVQLKQIADLEAELKEERQRSRVMSLRNGWTKAEELQARIAELEKELADTHRKHKAFTKSLGTALQDELAHKDRMIEVLAEDIVPMELWYCENEMHPARFRTKEEAIKWATAKARKGKTNETTKDC